MYHGRPVKGSADHRTLARQAGSPERFQDVTGAMFRG
jgi:hypothetical protein